MVRYLSSSNMNKYINETDFRRITMVKGKKPRLKCVLMASDEITKSFGLYGMFLYGVEIASRKC